MHQPDPNNPYFTQYKTEIRGVLNDCPTITLRSVHDLDLTMIATPEDQPDLMVKYKWNVYPDLQLFLADRVTETFINGSDSLIEIARAVTSSTHLTTDDVAVRLKVLGMCLGKYRLAGLDALGKELRETGLRVLTDPNIYEMHEFLRCMFSLLMHRENTLFPNVANAIILHHYKTKNKALLQMEEVTIPLDRFLRNRFLIHQGFPLHNGTINERLGWLREVNHHPTRWPLAHYAYHHWPVDDGEGKALALDYVQAPHTRNKNHADTLRRKAIKERERSEV